MTKTVYDNIWICSLAAAVLFLMTFSYFLNPYYPIVLIIGVSIIIAMLYNKNFAMLLCIAILPLAGTELFQTKIMGIPGLKPANIFILLLIVSLILARKFTPIYEKEDIILFVMYSICYFCSVIRSTSYIENYSQLFWSEKFMTVKYMLSHWLIPYMFSLVFLVIILFFREREDIISVVKYIMVSINIFSIVMIVIYLFRIPDKSNFEVVRATMANIFGMHGNGISAAYIITFPLILSHFLYKRKAFTLFTLLLSLVNVAILSSRAAYFSILAASIIVLTLHKKLRYIPIAAVLVGLIISFIPASVIDRAMTGVNDKDLNVISAGRIEDIWEPIIYELKNEPIRLLLGYGRYGVIATNAFKTNKILMVNHSHNVYLDTILDGGIIFLIIFLLFIGKNIMTSYYSYKYSKDIEISAISIGIFAGIMAYLLKGITGGSFIPDNSNAFLWILLSLGSVIHYFNRSFYN